MAGLMQRYFKQNVICAPQRDSSKFQNHPQCRRENVENARNRSTAAAGEQGVAATLIPS